MRLIGFDCETHYTKAYSLKKLPTEEYVRHPNFELIIASTYDSEGEFTAVTVGLDATARHVQQIDWSDTALVAWNAHFDGLIATTWLGIRPAYYFCPMQMWRTLGLGVHGGESLESATAYGLKQGWDVRPKDPDIVASMIDKRLKDFTPQELHDYAEYCKDDGYNALAMFSYLRNMV